MALERVVRIYPDGSRPAPGSKKSFLVVPTKGDEKRAAIAASFAKTPPPKREAR